jgi:formate hydrogenlyase subunit 4
MDVRALSELGLRIVLGSLGLALFGIFFGLVYKGIDRKLSAHMQGRIGPPLRQPFRDVAKLFVKENIIPDQAIPWVFNLVPLIGLIGTLSILVYLPLGGFPPLFSSGADIIVILYLLILPSLCLVIGGFASGSPYAIVGAQREMATMIAYEFPLAILIVTIAWSLLQKGLTEVFSFSTIASTPVWNQVSGPLGFIGFAILLMVLLLVTPAELSKIPFDAAEAETELAGGLLVEYSGRNLAMFYLTDGVKTVVMASLIVVLFFPYNLSNILGLGSYQGLFIDGVFFLFKVFLVILFSVTLIRVAIARLKIDQIVYTYWIPLTLASLVGLILVMWDSVIMNFFTSA